MPASNIGNDLVITLSAEGGQLQLNAFEPTDAQIDEILNPAALTGEGR